MSKQLLMGNEAIAFGALHAGVQVITGYPGTPSSEILETAAKNRTQDIYVEWSVNEKTALEVAAGAAYAGARSMVTMKQVGLNVAADPLMSLSYIGVKGGMVVVVADDPGPISSQTEQDTRHFGQFAKLPVFDPSTPEEAYEMIQDAFTYSEQYHLPVLFRPTTRVCHSYSAVQFRSSIAKNTTEGFIKDSKWVIFPRLSYQKHLELEDKQKQMAQVFSDYAMNHISGNGKKGIACSGVSYAYVKEALALLFPQAAESPIQLLKISTTPVPERLCQHLLAHTEEILVLEELDPVIEKELIFLRGRDALPANVHGKLDGMLPVAGEYSVQIATEALAAFMSIPLSNARISAPPALPIRPPVLCAGCPHRASFYAVKKAMEGKRAVFSGDIGCYTLGNAKPLEMVDTCLCMGAGITIAQGLQRVEPDTVHFAFIGDSTLFHTGIPGIINAVYNQTELILVILDNSTTAMTGNQPHPGTGKTMMGSTAERIPIRRLLEGIGVDTIYSVNPFNHKAAKTAVLKAAAEKGVRVLIFEAPCIALSKPETAYTINDACISCQACIKQLGCPAISSDGEALTIDPFLCTGCGLCSALCPVDAITKGAKHDG